MDDILVIEGLTKYYGKVKGIENLSLNLKKGEVFGLIGPNGSGKSTTIRLIMNLLNKDKGDIYIFNQLNKKNNVDIKKKIGYLPSEIHLYDDLKVKDIFDYHMTFYKEDLNARRQELVEKLSLDENKKIEDLSLGNLKKVGIVLAFMHNPDLIILDEPTSGLDPIIQQVFYQILLEEKLKGKTILYSTHILQEISRVCDRVGVIKDGELLKVELVSELYKKNLTHVTIQSKQIDKIIKHLNLEDYARVGQAIKFKNTMHPDDLVKGLSTYRIEQLLIEEASLEDILLHYYR